LQKQPAMTATTGAIIAGCAVSDATNYMFFEGIMKICQIHMSIA